MFVCVCVCDRERKRTCVCKVTVDTVCIAAIWLDSLYH